MPVVREGIAALGRVAVKVVFDDRAKVSPPSITVCTAAAGELQIAVQGLAVVAVRRRNLFPSKLLEFFFGADEFDGAVVEQDAAALGVVVVKRKQLGPAVLIPTRFGLEQKHHIRRRIRLAIRIHRIVAFAFVSTQTPQEINPVLRTTISRTKVANDHIAPLPRCHV